MLARDGMTGALDYGVLLTVAEANGIKGEHINILMQCVNENEIRRAKRRQE